MALHEDVQRQTSDKPIGVILLQLGTPDAPTPKALRTYLHEFLLDRRVIDVSRAIWWPILYLFVLPLRPARSAKLYRNIWTKEGSPLAVISNAQAKALSAELEQRYPGRFRVEVGMRYGNPTMASALAKLKAAGCDRLLAVPMYPQYASATTGSSVQHLFDCLRNEREIPAVRVMPPYFDAPEYIDALAAAVNDATADFPPDHVLISFHGVPKRYITLGDPYQCHCLTTADKLIEKMGWDRSKVSVTFQSLFGREEWIAPYTEATMRGLAKQKIGRLASMCPGFTADCLETLEEMDITNGEIYRHEGGGDYRLMPCLNTHPAWIAGLTALVTREAAGWLPDRS